MGQLSSRLRELVVEYGQDDRAWQPELDALAALEGRDAKAAHERFEALRRSLAHTRFHDLRGKLLALGRVDGVPDADLRGADLKQVDREIARLALALQRARRVVEASDETRQMLAGLERRRAAPDLAAFDRLAFDALGEALERAEAARRDVAGEARAEERYRRARARAAKLEVATVEVPDVGSDAVPDAQEAHRRLDALEAALDEAEKVEDLLTRVRRELRDPAVKEYKAHVRRLVGERAEREAALPDRAEAARLLAESLQQAADLRKHASGLAEEAARARRRGLRGPERGRRGGDAQDGYG